MTDTNDDSGDRHDRLARLSEALRHRAAELTPAEVADLAHRFALAADDVQACHRAVAALARLTAPVAPAGIDPGLLPDTYEVLGELGRGGMGVVYRARHRALGREVAIKVLQTGEQLFQQMLHRFEVEAKSLARLRHPHIVAVHDVGRSHGHVFYTMDLIEGTSLDRVLKDAGQHHALSPSRAVRILQQITSAIEHSHEHGVIHRDLKPANILLDGHDTAFVADFGLARDRTVDVGVTTTGQIMGTPAYMSPEAMRGDTERIGERSDVWALGAMLYQMLCGELPFPQKNLADTMQAVLHQEPVPLRKQNPRVPRDLELVCHKALAKSPDDRYATARALREDLERFQQGLPVLAQRPSVRRRLSRFVRRNRGAVLGAVATAAAVALAMLFLRPDPDSPTVIDAMIRTANEREAKEDFAGAAELYEHARGVLGRDAHRAMRHEGGVTTGPLIDQVWRGILRCQAELAWQRAIRGEYAQAAADFAGWMRQRPADAAGWQLPDSLGETCALQTLAGDAEAAHAAVLASKSRTWTWSTVRRRLRPVWNQPTHQRWRDAGAVIAMALRIADDDPEFEARLDGFDSLTALCGAWPHAESLAPTVRERLRQRLRDAAFGADTPLQWGGPDRDAIRALAAICRDEALATATRREALDVLCAIVDLPWRPDADDALALTGARGRQAVDLALAALAEPRETMFRRRVDFAVERLADRPDDQPLRDWLAAHTGVDAATDFATWWPPHREENLATRLGHALGDDAVQDFGEALAARFGRLTGVQRLRYHLWLCLRSIAGSPLPTWPAFEPEPTNLVATWQFGVRHPDEKIMLEWQFAQWTADGATLAFNSTTSREITLDESVNTWIGSSTVRWGDAVQPGRAFAQRMPQATVCLPGVGDANQRGDVPERRTNLDAHLLLADGLCLSWSASIDNAPGFHGVLPEGVPQPLGRLGLRMLDGWYGGFEGETGGPCIVAAGAHSVGPGGSGDLPDWSTACDRALAAASGIGAPGLDPAARTAQLATGAGALELLAGIPLARQVRDLLPRLREYDAAARRLRADPEVLLAMRGTATPDVEPVLRARLAAGLAGRLVNGDATALAEPGFAERLAEAEADLGLGPWWWFRVLVASEREDYPGLELCGDRAPLRALAGERLGSGPDLPPPLLLILATSTDPATLPAGVRERVTRFTDGRAGRRLRVLLPFGALGLAALASLVWTLLRAVRQREAMAPAAATLALCGLLAYTAELRFGVFRMPPATVGLGITAAASLLLLRQRGGPLATSAAILTTITVFAGLAADSNWHEYASAVGGILSAFAFALLALQIGDAATLRRLRWIPAALLAIAGTVGAAVGIDVLITGRDVESFAAAVDASTLAPIGHAAAIVGATALAALLSIAALRGAARRAAA